MSSPVLFDLPLARVCMCADHSVIDWRSALPDAVVREQYDHQHLSRSLRPAESIAPTDREQALLKDVAAHPISTITQRYERIGWNYKIGNSIKDAVIAKGFATFDSVITPTGQVKILSLTRGGCDALTRAGVSVARAHHGGAEHEYWKFIIARRLREQGFSVTAEYSLGGGKRVDLRATRDGRVLLIEVETGKSEIAANIAKCSGLDDDIAFVFTDKRVRNQHEASIHAALPHALVLTTSELRALC